MADPFIGAGHEHLQRKGLHSLHDSTKRFGMELSCMIRHNGVTPPRRWSAWRCAIRVHGSCVLP